MARRALSRVALQIWIVLFIVFFGAEVVHLEPGLRIVTQVLYGVPLAIWALRRLRGPADRLDLVVLGLLALYGLVCLFSRDVTESLGTLALATAFAAWFLIVRREEALRGPIALAAATGLALTLAFNAYLLVQEKLAWYAAVGGAPFEGVMTFPWESVNALPLLVLGAIPMLAWVEATRVRTLLTVIVALSGLVVVPLSLGRAGWLGLATAGVAFVALHPMTARATARLRPSHRLLGATGLVIAVMLGVVIVGPRLVRAIGESGRLLLWEQGLNIFASSPLTGMGPGLYAWVRLDSPPAHADLLELRLVHNVPIQVLIDGGLVLAVGLVAAAVVYASAVLRTQADWSFRARISVACLIGFAAAFTLDDVGYLPALTAIVLTAAAILVPALPKPTERSRPIAGWLLPALIGLAAAISLPSVMAVDSARADAQAGRAAMVRGDYEGAAHLFGRAAAAHPESGGYWLSRGMALAYSGEDAGAIEAYRRAIEAAPGDPRGYAALAALDPNANKLAMLGAAADRSLGDPQYAVRLGIELAERGELDAAAYAWGRAVELQPQLLRLLPYAASGLTIEGVAEEALLILDAEPRPGPHENLVALWDIALALDDLPSDAEPAWRAVDAARHGDLGLARQLADAAVAAAPYEAHGYQALAAVAAFSCDREAETSALELERLALNAWAPADPDPRLRREFIYREASLGASQPPGVGLGIEVDRWPWPLVDRPTGCP